MDFPCKNTRVGCHFLLQGIFLTQGSNPHLLHWRRILYPLSLQGIGSGSLSPGWWITPSVAVATLTPPCWSQEEFFFWSSQSFTVGFPPGNNLCSGTGLRSLSLSASVSASGLPWERLSVYGTGGWTDFCSLWVAFSLRTSEVCFAMCISQLKLL